MDDCPRGFDLIPRGQRSAMIPFESQLRGRMATPFGPGNSTRLAVDVGIFSHGIPRGHMVLAQVTHKGPLFFPVILREHTGFQCFSFVIVSRSSLYHFHRPSNRLLSWTPRRSPAKLVPDPANAICLFRTTDSPRKRASTSKHSMLVFIGRHPWTIRGVKISVPSHHVAVTASFHRHHRVES